MADNCNHKCHEVGLNPWVESCPICGCKNSNYDPNVSTPEWLKEFQRERGGR